MPYYNPINIGNGYINCNECNAVFAGQITNCSIHSPKDLGNKEDIDKPMFSCLPPEGMLEIGKVEQIGVKKYGRHNYRKGIEVSRLTDAIMRHWIAFVSGEDRDNEDGNHHLAAIAWNALVAIQMAKDYPELDDRYKKS